MLFEDEDIPHEEDCLRNPYSLKSWLRYIEFKTKECNNWIAVYLIYERALKQLPGSYKLWYNYLKLRRAHLKSKCISDPEYEEVNNAYDRALAYMNKVRHFCQYKTNSFSLKSKKSPLKMPRIWIDYCEFLFEQCLITRTRKACDRALRSLPITQHARIWPIYLKLVETYDIPDTGFKVYKRYSKVRGRSEQK
jgi:pre-mRNA-splicing factor SYF1